MKANKDLFKIEVMSKINQKMKSISNRIQIKESGQPFKTTKTCSKGTLIPISNQSRSTKMVILMKCLKMDAQDLSGRPKSKTKDT